MAWFRKPIGIEPLAVSMPGVKLGDRLLVVGCSDAGLIAALAAKAGLTGRACAVDSDQARVTRAAADVERAGSLIETAVARLPALPYDDASFDVVVARDVVAEAAGREPLLREVHRVLRPGGRCVVIDTVGGGLGGLFGGRGADAGYLAAGGAAAVLTAAGFRAVRTLAERGRLAFAEGVKRND